MTMIVYLNDTFLYFPLFMIMEILDLIILRPPSNIHKCIHIYSFLRYDMQIYCGLAKLINV